MLIADLYYQNDSRSWNANPTKLSNTLKQIADELFECVWPFCEIGA